MVVVTLINRLRSIQSLLLLMTSVVMGNKMEVCNSLLLGLCTREAALAVVTVSQTLLTRQSVKPWWDTHLRCKELKPFHSRTSELFVMKSTGIEICFLLRFLTSDCMIRYERRIVRLKLRPDFSAFALLDKIEHDQYFAESSKPKKSGFKRAVIIHLLCVWGGTGDV